MVGERFGGSAWKPNASSEVGGSLALDCTPGPLLPKTPAILAGGEAHSGLKLPGSQSKMGNTPQLCHCQTIHLRGPRVFLAADRDAAVNLEAPFSALPNTDSLLQPAHWASLPQGAEIPAEILKRPSFFLLLEKSRYKCPEALWYVE